MPPPQNNDDLIVPMHNRAPINFNAIQDTKEPSKEDEEETISDKDK